MISANLFHTFKWIKINLFSSKLNTILTLISLLFIFYFLTTLLSFVFFSAEWKVIDTNLRLLLIGPFPENEEWRIWASVYWITALSGFSFAHYGSISRKILLYSFLSIFLLMLLIEPMSNVNLFILSILSIIFFIVGYLFHSIIKIKSIYKNKMVLIGWAITLPLVVLFLKIFGGVETTKWGGYFLNIMLAWTGIIFGFIFGLLLAIGRASSLVVIKYSCTVYIEVIRAAPLVAWLFFAYLVIPDLLPDIFANKVDIALRVVIVLSGFTAAYIAEIIRGGLQSVHFGQIEAAKALGMNAYQSTSLIILPQAIRAVIPALVSQFIALWKDTTLLLAAGLAFRELLGSGKAALSQLEFIGKYSEVYLFVALLFWIVSFSMSRFSLNFEKKLGLNKGD
ncbi:MAG: general L-amino acid transport system permease protein [Chloroflexi bacterium]|jgi:general L-amino acid transport system permease protein|nr:MAG: general L-amino acid transport system permease protein [Chloroflexota bacterium]|tara:strand:+ start:724 stop:1908 length:1185 start_codon:yes stop_codon:yes gene_type:complete